DEDRAAPPGVRLQQVPMQPVDELLRAGRPGRVRNAQLVAHRGQELDGAEPRVEDEREVDVGGQLLQEASTHTGLAGAHLASELNEATVLAHAVDQVRERLAVSPAHVE